MGGTRQTMNLYVPHVQTQNIMDDSTFLAFVLATDAPVTMKKVGKVL
jgi:hypothetical protein